MLHEHDWEESYRSHPGLWSGRPNPQLVARTTGLPAGSALDVGCGEGGDAIWLAGRGWQVTAVDVAPTALERGAAHAAAAGPDLAGRIRWLQADVTGWAPQGEFDLVTTHFLHLRGEPRRALFARLAAAVAPGGTLLVVGHHPRDLEIGASRPHEPDMFFTAEEVAASLDADRWDVVAAEAAPRPAAPHEGEVATVYDAVLVARTRG
jgi:SAM-dependent methyltransferase